MHRRLLSLCREFAQAVRRFQAFGVEVKKPLPINRVIVLKYQKQKVKSDGLGRICGIHRRELSGQTEGRSICRGLSFGGIA